MEAVAKSAGVSTSLIYHHFGDRSTLLQGALEHIGTRAAVYARPDGRLGRDMVEQMLLAEIQSNPDVRVNSAAWGELRGEATFDPTLHPLLTQLTQQWAGLVAAVIQVGHADGSIRLDLAADELGVQLTAAVEGVSGRWLTDQLTTAEARSLLRSMIQALLGPRP